MRFLNRAGSKDRIAQHVIKYFPCFDALVSPFLGTGAIEFKYLGKVKYLIANDLDGEVFNLYEQIITNFDELIKLISMTPYHEKLLKKKGRTDLERAALFLMNSNFSFMSSRHTYKFENTNAKRILKFNLMNFYRTLVDNKITSVQFMCAPYQDVFKKIGKRLLKDRTVFIYCDPPYIGTDNRRYNAPAWSEENLQELIDILVNTKQKFAVSEFYSSKLKDLVKPYGLNIVNLLERQNLKNRQEEILIMNYEPEPKESFKQQCLM